jgi:hypothetical protein
MNYHRKLVRLLAVNCAVLVVMFGLILASGVDLSLRLIDLNVDDARTRNFVLEFVALLAGAFGANAFAATHRNIRRN